MPDDYITIENPISEKNIGEHTFLYAMEVSNLADEAIPKTQTPEYLHWEKIKYKTWIPKNLSAVEFWAIVKIFRRGGATKTAIRTPEGTHFTWNKLPRYDQIFHELDLNTGGRLVDSQLFSEEEKKTYISRGIIEESIASAQLEGAHTTREYAKKMIREGRAPVDTAQKMILNNYHTMAAIEDELKEQPMSLDLLLEIHRMLTKDTLEKSDQEGRFRTNAENVVVASADNRIAYVPPDMAFVEEEIKRLIDYANDTETKEIPFLHPVVKAISLHFWIGFLHPFVDGNGRLARALFYWYLLKKGYWTFAFIPVSTRIKKSPGQYAKSYIYSEQDDCDLTYFIDYNLRKIEAAKKDFLEYVHKQSSQTQDVDALENEFPDLNHRQLNLVKFLRAYPKERTNITAMKTIYGVSELTAINDLKDMVNKDLLSKRRKGRNIFYYPTSKLL